LEMKDGRAKKRRTESIPPVPLMQFVPICSRHGHGVALLLLLLLLLLLP